ncbi:PREDICTED: acyl-CoA synthetase family member 4 [Polistes dominula]|uniref:Acyl-CoA synthetase family member 4 n=1 Tax=Polistes dominula TaxID=743375 RepID=A0ABM1IUR7_POLDO|nr:PREDICTED: acyl-CoA synthetase family member 4 [Polistes dominula]
MEPLNKKQKLNNDDDDDDNVNDIFKSLIDIIDWNYLNNTAVEYHEYNKIYTITYKHLNEGRYKIALKVLKYIEHFEFIGICDDVPEFCIPTLILGILTKGCGFVNLSLKNVTTYNKFVSTLYIKYIFLRHPVDVEDIICKFKLYGAYIYLTIVKEAQERYIENVHSGYAYAISTSGSTGEEKICKILHSCIVPNIIDLKLILRISHRDKIAQLTSLTFDPSIIEIFLSLHSASTIFMVSKRIKNDADRLLNVIHWSKVTVLQTTPSLLFHRWSPERLSSTILGIFNPLHVIILGGEHFPEIDKLKKIRHIENNTAFFNIYGITEVSCWASINEIVKLDRKSIPSNLGKVLSNTIFEVRSEYDGSLVTEGSGHLFIGSSSRISVIDNEVFHKLTKPVFRNTGDIVHIDHLGRIFYQGRHDDIIKRYGNKLNLLKLNEIINKLDFVHNCYSWWNKERHKLHLCIHIRMINGINKYKLKQKVKLHLESLPDFYKPDKIHFMNDIQLTKNGKICKKYLQNICTQDKIVLNNYQDEIEDIFTSLWDNYLYSKTYGFIKSGGTSIMALQISTEICELVNIQFPNLIGMLLKDSTFEECLTYLKSSFNLTPNEIDVSINNTSKETCAIMDKSISNNSNNINEENICLWQICKGETNKHISFNNQILKSYKKVSNIRVKSTFNLISCVDSSPTVFQYNKKIFVTVGSHLGVICTVELEAENNRDAYKIQLPNSVEASIVVLDNFKGIVGCYDHHIYCFCLKTGEIVWKYETGDIVKCTALLSESNNVLYIGSYDKNIYCLSTENGRKIWNVKFSESSITAKGILHSTTESVLFGTLGGTCIALNQSNGNIYWRREISSSIFVSPVILHNGFVLFTGVTGLLICFDIQADTKLWTYEVNNVILSKPITQYDSIKNCENIIACSRKSIHYLELNYTVEKHEPIAKYVKSVSSEIYTTPWKEDNYACIACKDGSLYIYELTQGDILSSIKLDGEIFSSPVVINGLIVVGCRDDNLYILEQCEENIDKVYTNSKKDFKIKKIPKKTTNSN